MKPTVKHDIRPPSTIRIDTDVARAFISLEEDILNLQSYIERSRIKNLDTGVYRGKLNSRRTLTNGNKHPGSLITENTLTLQNYRNSTLTEPIYSLVLSILGPHYSVIPIENILRLALLKIKLHEIFLKKISELILLKLNDIEVESEVKLLNLLYKFYENSIETKENAVENHKINELEQETQRLRSELKKEAKSRKESEDTLARYIISDRHKSEELESLNKKIKECDEIKNKFTQLNNEIEKIKNKVKETEKLESKNNLLQIEIDNLNRKFNESTLELEKLYNEIKKLKEKAEKTSIQEKEYINTINTLTKQLEDIKKNNLSLKEDSNAMNIELEKDYGQKIAEIEKFYKIEIENLKSNSISTIESLELKIEDLKNDLKSSQTELNSSNEKFQTMIKELSLLNSRLNSENITLKANLNKVVSEQSELKSQITQNNTEISQKTKEISELFQSMVLKDNTISDLNKKLFQTKSSNETEKFLNAEVLKLRSELSEKNLSYENKLVYCERLENEIKYLKNDLQKSKDMNERLQDQMAKFNQSFDEDTFENVMRHELYIMKETYEKRLKDLRDEIDLIKKKSANEVKKLKDDFKSSEHSREYLEIRLKALNNQIL